MEADIKKIISDAIGETVKPLSASLDEMKKQLADSKAALEQQERDSIIAQASKDGKVIPLSPEAIKTIPTPALKEMVNTLKKDIVPLRGALKPLAADGKPEKRTRADSARAIEDQITHQYGEGMLKRN